MLNLNRPLYLLSIVAYSLVYSSAGFGLCAVETSPDETSPAAETCAPVPDVCIKCSFNTSGTATTTGSGSATVSATIAGNGGSISVNINSECTQNTSYSLPLSGTDENCRYTDDTRSTCTGGYTCTTTFGGAASATAGGSYSFFSGSVEVSAGGSISNTCSGAVEVDKSVATKGKKCSEIAPSDAKSCLDLVNNQLADIAAACALTPTITARPRVTATATPTPTPTPCPPGYVWWQNQCRMIRTGY